MGEQPFDKEIMGVTYRLKQPSQQNPGIEMEYTSTDTDSLN